MDICVFNRLHVGCLLVVHSLASKGRLIIRRFESEFWLCPWPTTSAAPAAPTRSGVTYQDVKLLKNVGHCCANH